MSRRLGLTLEVYVCVNKKVEGDVWYPSQEEREMVCVNWSKLTGTLVNDR
jgi:hypothetical protein